MSIGEYIKKRVQLRLAMSGQERTQYLQRTSSLSLLFGIIGVGGAITAYADATAPHFTVKFYVLFCLAAGVYIGLAVMLLAIRITLPVVEGLLASSRAVGLGSSENPNNSLKVDGPNGPPP